MFNLLAANLHDGNVHNLTSSLGFIGNSLLMSTQQGVTSSSRGREFSSNPGKKISRTEKKKSQLLTSLLNTNLEHVVLYTYIVAYFGFASWSHTAGHGCGAEHQCSLHRRCSSSCISVWWFVAFKLCTIFIFRRLDVYYQISGTFLLINGVFAFIWWRSSTEFVFFITLMLDSAIVLCSFEDRSHIWSLLTTNGRVLVWNFS